ncbi:TetR/AcrR family transcriptional regulator [soil metagenome]
MTSSPRQNRGPSAATEKRAALIAAAREIFATRGIDAPLSAVAKLAGVGQGSLYRHFPTRYSLAVAAFEQNLDEVEQLAGLPGSTLEDVLGVLTDQAIASTAFYELVAIERADAAGQHLISRITSIIDAKMGEARSSGRLGSGITTDDVLLGIAMLAGALSKAPEDERRSVAARAWALLPFGP